MNYSFTKADLILSKALDDTFSVQDGVICDTEQKNSFDLSGYMILPGIIDLHGDGFERHLAPRRGAVKNIQEGLRATHAELAANGITTAVLAQFYSWEGGMRGPEFATQFFETLQAFAPSVPSTLLPQLRFETYMYAHYDNIVALCPKYDIPYLVFNDHLPHKELAAGKRPRVLQDKRSKRTAHLTRIMPICASCMRQATGFKNTFPTLLRRLEIPFFSEAMTMQAPKSMPLGQSVASASANFQKRKRRPNRRISAAIAL